MFQILDNLKYIFKGVKYSLLPLSLANQMAFPLSRHFRSAVLNSLVVGGGGGNEERQLQKRRKRGERRKGWTQRRKRGEGEGGALEERATVMRNEVRNLNAAAMRRNGN